MAFVGFGSGHFFSAESQGSATNSADVAERLRYTKPIEYSRADFLPEVYSQIVAVLRPSAGRNDTTAKRILLRLGDEETIQREVLRFTETKGLERGNVQVLYGSVSLSVLHALVPVMFRDDAEALTYHMRSNGGEAVESSGVANDSAAIIRSILVQAPEIPAATAKWAEGLNMYKFPELRDTMRQWWVENREHFELGAFDQLQPLRASDQPASAALGDASVGDQESAVPSEAVTSPLPQVAPSPLSDDHGGAGLRAWWLWGGAGVVALAAITVLVRARR